MHVTSCSNFQVIAAATITTLIKDAVLYGVKSTDVSQSFWVKIGHYKTCYFGLISEPLCALICRTCINVVPSS